MKKYIMSIGICLCMASCLNDGFLDVDPKDRQTEATAFSTYDNFKTYAWGLYNIFYGYGNDQNMNYFEDEYNADNMIRAVSGFESQYAYQTARVEATDTEHWDYKYIRRANLMLDNIDGSSLTETEKEHWRSVGYFFRAYKYFMIMSDFGDIPWIEHVLTDESPELYAPRDSRDLVAKNILENLQYAAQHIKAEGDGENTINADVVNALISRYGLFEGTWRKYHGLQDAETYLRASVEASEKVMANYTTLHTPYDELFNSEDLSGVEGIILYKKYETAQLCHGLTRMVRTGESKIEMTKDAVDSYLCSNGLPIGNVNSQYGGDKDVYAQFTDRDYRLYFTVCPPYRVNLTGAAATSTGYELTGNAQDEQFINLMAKISGETYHRLPTLNFKGFYVKEQPHFTSYNWSTAWNASEMGFWMWKYYNIHTDCTNATGVNTTDAPLFRLGEILLNYAEAKWELGEFDNSIADLTINKLRQRAGVQPMNVDVIGADFDPARDPDVDPVLWEIRRERRVELMGEGFRFDDLRRWKKGEYLNKQPLGVYVADPSYYNNAVKVNADGYAWFFNEPLGWLDKYYLRPIPLNQQALNPQLGQNPGWENEN